ncbi:MAG: sigma-54-dependent transcriptional regulator [Janthinobacterium lividum]
MPTILVCDDDAALREGLAEAIADLGHRVVEAADGHAALDAVAEGGIDAVLLDLRMPGPDGIEVLRRIRARPNPPPVAILTAVATAQNTIAAMRGGAVDHLAKPIGPDELADVLARLLQARPAAAIPAAESPDADAFIGTSAAMRAVQKSIGLLADGNASVLVTGETGTGKEVVARALHAHGRRAPHPFVAVNCAAIPAELLESQLFGHARGAFTGATSDRTGSFREAHRGTLFLDEIGDMALPMQAKLLRVLQDRTVTPVGGPPVAIDVRIVSATHRDLADAVAQGRFREDLFYRLGVVPVALPPLRERLADLIPLAEHFLALASPDAPRRLAPDAAARLLAHPWPGNVRELRNAMERVAALARQPTVAAADLDFLRAGTPDAPLTADWLEGDLPTALARLESEMIRRALHAAGNNRAEAARRLGINRQALYEKLRRHGLGDA